MSHPTRPRRSAGIAGAFLTVVLLALATGRSRAADVRTLNVVVNGAVRTGLVARPQVGGGRVAGRPLVVLLHGHMGSAAQVFGRGAGASPLSVWLRIADRETLCVAALDGNRDGDGQRGWNDCRQGAPGNPSSDDVAFVAAVVAQLELTLGTDPTRVYVMGMSNGGMMAFRIALQLEPPPAAFAAVCAGMADGGPCGAPTRPVPALLMVGADDPLVPFGGGEVHFYRKQRGAVIGAQRAAAAWCSANGLSGAPVVSALPHDERGNPTHVTRTVWGSATGPQVELLRVDGGGHVEPSISQHVRPVYELVVGRQNHDLECAEEAWSFFRGKRSTPTSAR